MYVRYIGYLLSVHLCYDVHIKLKRILVTAAYIREFMRQKYEET